HLIIGRQNSYHGSTLGTLGIGGNVNRRRLFMPMLFDHPKIEAPYCYRCPYGATYPGCGIRCAEELDRTIRRIGARYIAAFVAEPVGGSTAGALVPPEEYWPRIREICTVHDVLLIADEVMTGCGRTGRNFAVDHWGVVPDLIGTAKGLAACYYPVGALIVSDRVAEAFRKGSGVFAHSHTFNGMPAASAAVVAVLEYMKKHRLAERAARWGELINKEWVPELVTQDLVGDVRGKGLLWGLELVKDRVSKEPFPAAAGVASRLKALALERGMTLYPGRSMVDGERGDNVIVAPPLVIAREEMARVREILLDSLKALAREL
ncbi:MAG: aminotransferase class III-fold pyridoxal phosphate-dependent enzyme, partial [Synergistales bacterium]|nr:aminotransferase class III-fold pyridoxal phosphate-dependent enzyme [Synergistales bacterium]